MTQDDRLPALIGELTRVGDKWVRPTRIEQEVPEEDPMTALWGEVVPNEELLTGYQDILGDRLQEGLLDTPTGTLVDTNQTYKDSVDYGFDVDSLLEELEATNGDTSPEASIPSDLLTRFNLTNVSTVGDLLANKDRLDTYDMARTPLMEIEEELWYDQNDKPYYPTSLERELRATMEVLDRDPRGLEDVRYNMAQQGYTTEVLEGMSQDERERLVTQFIKSLPEGKRL